MKQKLKVPPKSVKKPSQARGKRRAGFEFDPDWQMMRAFYPEELGFTREDALADYIATFCRKRNPFKI